MMVHVAPALAALERFFLPNACVACNQVVEPRRPDALLCGVCLTRLRTLAPGCPRCRHPMPPVGPCRFCADWTALDAATSAVWHDGPARAVVHALKYAGYHRLASECADMMARVCPRPRHSVLVPIPLTPARQRRRGYNQAARLARALSERWRLPVWPEVLRRRTDAVSQTALTPDQRLANVAGAFSAAAPRPGAGRRHRLILVDDVLTTGATLRAAARALQSAGWSGIEAVTFARALPYALRLEDRAGVDHSPR